MKNNIIFGAIVVLYNPQKDEMDNIKTYFNDVDFTVVVDNSDDDHQEIIHSKFEDSTRLIYYSEYKNIGLCKAFNIGVELLKQKGCTWAVLFDADSKLETNIFNVYRKAIEDFQDDDVALFAPVHIFDRSNAAPYLGYKNILWSMTSGWGINIEIFKKQNGFFEALFVDGLDKDYCFKSHKNGYEVIECGQAVINHKPAETRSFLGFKYGIAAPNRYYMQARQLIWNWKEYRISKVLFTYAYKWFKVIFLFPNKKEYVCQMIQGTKEGIQLFKIYGHKD